MLVFHKKDIQRYLGMDVRLDKALQMIADGVIDTETPGRKDDSDCLYHSVQYYETKLLENTCFEAHEQWIDIQYVRAGQERIDVLLSAEGLVEVECNKEADCKIFREEEAVPGNQICLKAGMLAVFYPEDIHKPCICIDKPNQVEKVVFKIKA